MVSNLLYCTQIGFVDDRPFQVTHQVRVVLIARMFNLCIHLMYRPPRENTRRQIASRGRWFNPSVIPDECIWFEYSLCKYEFCKKKFLRPKKNRNISNGWAVERRIWRVVSFNCSPWIIEIMEVVQIFKKLYLIDFLKHDIEQIGSLH